MNTAAAESWPRNRWLYLVALVFVAQLAFIFVLGAHKPIATRTPSRSTPLTLAAGKTFPLAEYDDPSLFALPNRHNFSGAARRLTPRNPAVSADWTEPFRPLALHAEKLGDSFAQFLNTSAAVTVPIAQKIFPPITALDTAAAAPLPAQSSVRFEGGLAARSLAAPLDLPAQPSADILADSVVRVLVDARGRVVSAALLTGSGLADADTKALELARTARFEPLPNNSSASPTAALTWGRMIFNWHIVAPPAETALIP
jgi:TonB family protein